MPGRRPSTPPQGGSPKLSAAAPRQFAERRSKSESSRSTSGVPNEAPLRWKSTASRNAGSGSPIPSGSQQPAVQRNSPRHFLEAMVVLAIAVAVFRAFVLEGFLISTGSMAPALWGHHFRLTCPDCRFEFAVGAPEAQANSEVAPRLHVCPNCRYDHIQSQDILVHEGDQLLVDKQAYLWQSPQRWSPVVFRNPLQSTQAFAKRIIGLPGETISLREGDIYIRGAIERKSLAEQRELRILIADSQFQPQFQDPNWQPRWAPANARASLCWTKSEAGFRFEPSAEAASDKGLDSLAWLNYRHWTRVGGSLKTTVPLERWPSDIPLPTPEASLRFDPVKQTLSCQGALPAEISERLQSLSTNEQFRQSIQELFDRSHEQPITDSLVYNPTGIVQEKPVRDVMVELDVLADSVQSQLFIKLFDGQFHFLTEIDFADHVVRLTVAGHSEVVRTGPLPELPFEQPVRIEVSVFDRQVLVAVNGKTLFEPYAYRPAETDAQPIRIPIALAAQGAPLNLLRQRVYRDVYYRTPPRHEEATPVPVEYRLGPQEYFVLGDNSAISIDSRHWPAGSVRQELLIGRPVIVHLPSRKMDISLGPYSSRIRMPDLERIRLLR